MESSDLIVLLLAFCGGIIGASMGGLNAFILCGISVISGTIYGMITGDNSFNEVITWGPVLSPHVTFGGAVAGAAYAARQGKLQTGRNVSSALFGLNSTRVLIVGGIFGAISEGIRQFLDFIPAWNGFPIINSIALALIITGIAVRLILGKSGLTGKVEAGKVRWKTPDGDWQPWSMPATQLIVIALAFSLPAAFINSQFPNSTGLVFGLAAFSLLFFQAGSKIPVTHHIVLAAEFGTQVSGSIWWGVIFGLLSAIIAEICAGLFLIHGDTHIDPPALALIVIYSLVPLLTSTNIYYVPFTFVIAITLVLTLISIYGLSRLKEE